MNIPETTSMPRRPVYERLLRRKHLMPLEPPTRREYEDALNVLIEDTEDELTEESRRIIEERDRRALEFDTSVIPDGATITSATVRIIVHTEEPER